MLGGIRSGSSDLLLRPASSQPASSYALLNPFKGHMQPAECRASAGLWPGREQAGHREQTWIAERQEGQCPPRTSCLVSPWYDQTCTVSGPVQGSSAASLWPSCCPQTCHLEWLLDSGYGSCMDKVEGGRAREPHVHRVDGSIIIPVPQSCQFLNRSMSLQHKLEPCMNQELQGTVWALLQGRHQGTLPDLSLNTRRTVQEETTGLTMPGQAQAKQCGWDQLENGKDPKGRKKSEPGSEDLSLVTTHLHQPCIQHLKHHQACCLITCGTKLSMFGNTEPAAGLSQTVHATGCIVVVQISPAQAGEQVRARAVCLPSEHVWFAGQGRRGSYRCLKSA